MAAHIIITAAETPHVVRAGDIVLGRTTSALRLVEGGGAAVIYVPRGDIDMSLLEASARRSTCPWKGVASYFSIRTPGGLLTDAVWSYEAPKPDVAAIAGHLAFYPDRVTVTPA
jgi:uncharacterized protein (DUF427 family)